MNTMPSRNYSVITESPINQAQGTSDGITTSTSNLSISTNHKRTAVGENPKRKNTNAIGEGEMGAGATHLAASAEKDVETIPGALNVAIRVEVDKHDPEGKTFKYGFASKF